MAVATGDTVTIEYTGRLQDGTVFDTSLASVADENGLDAHPDREYTPLTVEVGSGQIIEGLEDGLVGLEAGDEESITVPPEAAYGARTEDRVVEYDTGDLEEMIGKEPEPGMELQTEEGLPGRIVQIDEGRVRVDFNHELAGETLTFDVEVVAVD